MFTRLTQVSFRLLAAAALLAALPWFGAVSAQSNRPITRNGLIEAVRINGLSTAELVQIIRRRGVDFEMTSEAEAELRGAGARPEIIETARGHFRAPAAAASRPSASTSTPAAATSRPAANTSGPPVPPGPPLSKNEIVTLLQGGLTAARVEQFVEARGVAFSVTPDVAREITAAGGTRSLIGAITERAASGGGDAEASSPGRRAVAGRPAAPDAGAPDYDHYIDRIQASITSNNAAAALNYAQQAVQLDPSQPTAYSYIGLINLYERRDIHSAEQAMRAAIERGGSARFVVYHDHTGNFSQYCLGSFFVTKGGVSFKANDGVDTFEVEDASLKEAEVNKWVGSELGAFNIKPVQPINGRKNFNFAPYSRQKSESQLITRLIKGY